MNKKIKTNDGTKGGWLVGKRHYDEQGNPLGGIKAVVTDAGNKPVELEGGEVIINREASKKYWKELSRINQSAGNGVAIGPPEGADEDPEEYKDGGNIIEFNPNHIPNKWIVSYAKKIKSKHPEIWKLGGNIFGNEAFNNLERVSERGYWLDSEKWMYIKWRSYVARHIHDFRIEGVVAMLKWCDKVEKGWPYMKELIEEKMQKTGWKHKQASKQMKEGGDVVTYKDKYNTKYKYKKGESHSLEEVSKDTGVSMKGLQQIYDKGIGAYKTNPSSVRPNVTSKEQWAMARVYSSVMGGKAAKVDANELKMKHGGGVENELSIIIKGTTNENKYKGNYKKIFDLIDNDSSFYNPYGTSFEELKGNDFYITITPKPESFIIDKISKLKDVEIVNPDIRFEEGGKVGQEITCIKCDWDWNTNKSEEFDKYVCHNCGTDNSRIYAPKKLKGGGNVEWQKAKIGDSARVVSENKMGVIVKDYGRKFHLKFVDDTEKTYDADALDFYTFDEDEYDEGGGVHSTTKYKVGDKIKSFEVKKIVDGYASKYGANGKKTRYITPYLLLLSENGQERILRADKKSVNEAEQYYSTFGRKFKFKDWNMFESAEKMEDGGKYAGGGLVTTYGGEAKIGDKGQLSTRKGRIEIEITNITDKWVIFKDLTEGGKRKDSPLDKFIENYRGNAPLGRTVPTATTVQAKPDIYELKKPLTAVDLYNTKIIVNTEEKSAAFQKIGLELGITWGRGINTIQNTEEPYLFVDDEFGEGKQILGYSTIGGTYFQDSKNKEIFFDDLFQLKGTGTTTKSNKPVHELANYRIKTEQEFIDEYGADWRKVNIDWVYSMDWMFGKQITDLVKKIDYDYVLAVIKNGVVDRFETKSEIEGKQGNWNITPKFIKYDITAGMDFSTLFPDEQKTNVKVKDISEVKTERELIHDEYNDIIFLIENTLGTDSENMLSLKAQAKELKDKLDVLDLELKKKNTGELNLLDELFSASSVQLQTRYDLKPYNDGFAPDGQPTALPKNIYDWTMTEEFQNWFGNFTLAYNYRNSSYENVPCSIVVNKNYEPLVVYHGTGAEFSFFKFDKFPAMYFAENEAYSNWFAEIKGQQQGTQGYVYPFMLNIRTPLDLTYFEINDVSPDEFIDWMYLQTGLDADELKINKALTDPSSKHKAWMYLRNSPEMLQVLRDKKVCDGIVYYEDNPSVDVKSDAYKTKAYIVFNSNSAKIAEPSRHKLAISAMRSFYLKRGGKL